MDYHDVFTFVTSINYLFYIFRLLIQNHREKLISELESCEEPALSLHLAVLAIFTIVTQNMLHASGRQVPIVISYLKIQLKEEDYERLLQWHGECHKLYKLHKKIYYLLKEWTIIPNCLYLQN